MSSQRIKQQGEKNNLKNESEYFQTKGVLGDSFLKYIKNNNSLGK